MQTEIQPEIKQTIPQVNPVRPAQTGKWFKISLFSTLGLLSILFLIFVGLKLFENQNSKKTYTQDNPPIPTQEAISKNTTKTDSQTTSVTSKNSQLIKDNQIKTESLNGVVYTLEWEENFLNESDVESGYYERITNINFYKQEKNKEKVLIRNDFENWNDFPGFAPKFISSTSDFSKILVETHRQGTDAIFRFIMDTKTGFIKSSGGIEIGGEACNFYGEGDSKIQDNLFAICEFANPVTVYKYSYLSSQKPSLTYTLKDDEDIRCINAYDKQSIIKIQGGNLLIDICKKLSDEEFYDDPKFTITKTLSIPLIDKAN